MSSQPSSRRVLAIDPGREKSGLAVVDARDGCLHREIVPTPDLVPRAAEIAGEYEPGALVVGDRTGGRLALDELRAALALPVEAVDEHRSTEEARQLYLDTVPTRGLARLIPRGLRTPPRPIDDYAAWVLGRRYLGKQGDISL
jgi:RNase H-fold protein (predicted Holliday junction resolvase)